MHAVEKKWRIAVAVMACGVTTATASVTVGAAASRSPNPVVGAAAATCRSTVNGDINGDGFAEVAVGEPGDAGGRGSVHVFYGQRAGLVTDTSGTARNDEYLSQDSIGIPGTGEVEDRWGSATLLSDVNGDRCADLIVGSPGEDAGAGSLTVIYGSPNGLKATGAQRFGLVDVGVSAAAGQSLGEVLTAGDLNGDAIDDVGTGVSGAEVAGHPAAGGVAVFYGGFRGLNKGGERPALVTRDTAGVPGEPEDHAGFGTAVVAGDFDGNGRIELGVGATNGRSGGGVQVLTRAGAGFRGSQPIGVDTLGLPGERGRYCAFGFVLAAGDVHGDGIDDLAVADPSYGCRDEPDAEFARGAVVLLAGSADGLTVSGAQFWTQDSAGVAGASRLGNVFGESLAMGRLDSDAIDDLAIGAPGDTDGGSVTLLLGGTTGLSTIGVGGTRITQATPGIVGTPEPGDSFADTVSTANVQSRTQASLIVGIPGEDVSTVTDAGAVTQLSITAAGPDPRRSRTLTTDSAGVQGRAERGDQFGDSTRHWG